MFVSYVTVTVKPGPCITVGPQRHAPARSDSVKDGVAAVDGAIIIAAIKKFRIIGSPKGIQRQNDTTREAGSA